MFFILSVAFPLNIDVKASSHKLSFELCINTISPFLILYCLVKSICPSTLLTGASLEGFRSYGNMKHVLIDEAQDYSPLFYKIIKRSFPNASLTILGDLNQRIDKHSNVKNRNSITNIFSLFLQMIAIDL